MEIGGGGGAFTYVVSFPPVLKTARLLVTGCPEVAHSAVRLRGHLMYRQFFLRITVVQERKETLPRCDLCVMHIPAGRLIKYPRAQRYDRNTQIRWRRSDVTIVS